MPFYQCISLAGSLSQEQKEEIVREVTRIHCQETGGLPLFVQIQFDEVTSDNVFQNGKPSSAVRLHARIRAGRDAATKLRMLHAYTDLIARVARVPVDDVMVGFIETSYENVMEAGVRLPAPGEEKAWLAYFEQRASATSDVQQGC
jgi:phenylpyruvate tautomerase PptA (4-oxalocrotonate tautomerase family)